MGLISLVLEVNLTSAYLTVTNLYLTSSSLRIRCDLFDSVFSYAMATNWKSLADAKRASILSSIPEKWRLPKIPSVEEQKDVTGPYVEQYLNSKEIDITNTDAVGLAEKIAAGTLSAVDVTEAFCHRAALAHQLVREVPSFPVSKLTEDS